MVQEPLLSGKVRVVYALRPAAAHVRSYTLVTEIHRMANTIQRSKSTAKR